MERVGERDAGRLAPYLTVAEQGPVLGGQSGEISVRNVMAGPLGTSRLREAGLKFTGLGGRLQAALAWYEQKRIDYSAFADANLAVLGRGLELDLRAAVSERLGLLFSATRSRIYREPLTGASYSRRRPSPAWRPKTITAVMW